MLQVNRPPEATQKSFSPSLLGKSRSLFHHATLCVSAVFAVAPCPSVRLSVCLSVTFVHSIQTAEDIVKLLCRSGSPITLVFLTPAPVSNSKGNPFSGDAK